MRRFIRIAGISLAALISLLIIAVVMLTHYVNPNDYKAEIMSSAHKATGRNLSISGNISLSFFPWLGVNVQKIQLSNPEGFKVQNFASAEEAEIKLRLLPLLFGKIELGSLVLNGVELNLIENSSSTNNWSDLQAQEEPTSTSTATQKSESSPSFELINIENVAIHNAHIRYTDSQQNTLDFTQVDFDSSNIGMRQSFPVSLSLSFNQKAPARQIQFNGKAQVYIDPENQVYQIQSLNSDGTFSANPIKLLPFHAEANLKLDLKKKQWLLDKLKASIGQLQLNTKAQGTLNEFSAKGIASIPSFNAQNLLQQISPTTQFKNAQALKQVSANFDYSVQNSTLNIPNLKLTADQSQINANLSYAFGVAPAINFDVNADKINLDQYQTSTSAKTKTAENSSYFIQTALAAPASVKNSTLLPLSTLRGLAWKGKVQIAQLIYSGISFQKVMASTVAQSNTISINPLSALVHQGTVSGSLSVNLQSNTPSWNISLNLNKLNLDKALANGDKNSKLSGLLSLNTRLNTLGNTTSALLNNLQGSGNLSLVKGVLKGVDVNYWLKQGVSFLDKGLKNGLGKLLLDAKTNTNQTPFEDMQASFTIYNGVLNNQDLKLTSSDFFAKGNGSINLPQQSINYRVFAALNPSSKQILSKALTSNQQIPILITGSLDNPKVQLDMAVLTKSLLQNELKNQVLKPITLPGGAVTNILGKILTP